MKKLFFLVFSTSLFMGCGKDLLFPINRNDLIGSWFAVGSSAAKDICAGELHREDCFFYLFNSDGTFTTSKGLIVNDVTKEKKPTQICVKGTWEIQLKGDFNTKFSFDGKEVYWNINLSPLHLDRMNIFEKDCNHLGVVFKKEQ